MEKIYIKARAKINLNLEVIGKREDNYHNIRSVFQKVNLYDEIYIKKVPTEEIELKTNVEELNNKENIIYKAYQILKQKYKKITGVQVMINKKIPMQAGLAGGSTDAASFLLGMNQLFNLKLSKQQIESIGKNLGADVVPCFYQKAVLAEGIGEKITNIATNFKYYIVLIKPKINCNTKEMFEKIDQKEKKRKQPTSYTNNIIQALEQHNLSLLASNLYNQFEEVIEPKDVIGSLKKELKKQGAIGSLMTGTGSCVYGLFQNKQQAKIAYYRLKDKHQTYLCTSYNVTKEPKI